MNPGLFSQLHEFDPQFDVEESISLAKELTNLAERDGLILQVGRWLFSNVLQLSI
jgi:EAL domain-containing protein (putative c-di-GMP-specific phosphodiesterase class I)